MVLARLGKLQPERGVIIFVEIAVVVGEGDEIAAGGGDTGVARPPETLAGTHDLGPPILFREVRHYLRRFVGGLAVDEHQLDLMRVHQRRVELRERRAELVRPVSRANDVGDFHEPMPPLFDNSSAPNSSAMGFDL